MDTRTDIDKPAGDCGGGACGSCSAPAVPERPQSPGAAVFRIAAIDCSSEEAKIRRALEPVAGIRSLNFQLGARTLAITALASSPRLEHDDCHTVPGNDGAYHVAGRWPDAINRPEPGPRNADLDTP